MSGLLDGLTVIEMPGGVAPRYCGRLFAEHGATVIQAGHPSEAGIGFGGEASEAYAHWLDHRKWREADLASALRSAGGQAALVLAGQTAEAIADCDARLAAKGQAPLRVGITWFAPDGPYARWSGNDALIQAMSGVAYATGPVDGVPLLPRGHAPGVVAGAAAFSAALAAVLGRDAGWSGQRIDLNILEANMCFSEGGAAGLALSGEKVTRRGVNRFTPTYPGGIYQASDGWIGVTALTPPQWVSLCQLIGLPDLAKDPASLVALQRMNRADDYDAHLIPAFRTKPASYWLEEGQARRIPMAPVPSLVDLPNTPHWKERGSFAPVAGTKAAVGPAMPFHFEPMSVTGNAKVARKANTLPLAGLRVLDLSMGWAGPLAARHFADLGADVVKVESCTHFDWWRGFDGPIDGDPPPYETRPSFLMVNRNKRGVTLDLKAPEGKTLLRRLAAQSDEMIENYAPGVLDKLGVGPKALAAAVPGLVCVSMGALGGKGPWRGFRAYGSTVEQASGLPFINGEADQPPTMQHVAYGDPIAGLYGAIACLIALYGQRKQRSSMTIDLGQVECLFQLGADALVAQSVRDNLLPRTGSRHPLSALRMVAATKAPARWFAIAIETPTQWNALADAVARADLRAADDAGLDTMKRQEPHMEDAVRDWARAQDASAAVAQLQAAGIPAAPVLAAEDLLHDPQLKDFWRRAERPFIGDHVVPHAPYLLDGRRSPMWGPSPTLGQHNDDVLAGELKLSQTEIDALAARNIIGTRAIRESGGD